MIGTTFVIYSCKEIFQPCSKHISGLTYYMFTGIFFNLIPFWNKHFRKKELPLLLHWLSFFLQIFCSNKMNRITVYKNKFRMKWNTTISLYKIEINVHTRTWYGAGTVISQWDKRLQNTGSKLQQYLAVVPSPSQVPSGMKNCWLERENLLVVICLVI